VYAEEAFAKSIIKWVNDLDKERILIVDDEELIRDVIKEYIKIEGYITDEAENGKQALELFNRNSYDLIILDVMMPKMDGWVVGREIRKTSQVPIIMLTARGDCNL